MGFPAAAAAAAATAEPLPTAALLPPFPDPTPSASNPFGAGNREPHWFTLCCSCCAAAAAAAAAAFGLVTGAGGTTLGFGGALVVHVTARATTATVFLARVTVADVVVTDVVISIGRRLVLNRKRSVTIRGNARASDVDREVRLARS